MNTWYFEDKDAAARLRAAAASWIGTPFAERQGVKGAGCDCLHLIPALMKESGVEYTFKPGTYSLQETCHREESRLLAALRCEPRLVEFDKDQPPMIGDIVAIIIGHGVHHLGVVLTPPAFLHSIRVLGVHTARLDDSTWQKRLHGFFRVKA